MENSKQSSTPFKTPSKIRKKAPSKKVKSRQSKRIRLKRQPLPPSSPTHAFADFTEDKDFLKWYRNHLPLTQKLLNAKYVEKQNLEKDLLAPMSSQMFKAHTILFTFQEKFAREVLTSPDYYEIFDGFEPRDQMTSLTINETTLETTIDLDLHKPETSSVSSLECNSNNTTSRSTFE